MRKWIALSIISGLLMVGCNPNTPPAPQPIKVTSIQENQEVSSNAPVIGQVTTEKPVQKLFYKVNGGSEVDVSSGIETLALKQAISPQATTTTFSFSISSEKMQQGKNTITIIVQLNDGTRYSITITVIFNPDKPPVAGRDIVVFNDNNFYSGDNNNGSITKLPISDPSNIKFMKNLFVFNTDGIRKSAKTIWLYRGHNSNNCKGECDDNDLKPVLDIIANLAMNASTDSSESLTSIPADVKVLMMMMPSTSFTNTEINLLKKFATEGGRIVFVGEHVGFYGTTGIDTENDFLTKMGAVMRNKGNSVDCIKNDGSPTILTSSSIRGHQVTTDISSLSVACSSVITPGPNDFPLFYDQTNSQLLAGVAAIDLTPLPTK